MSITVAALYRFTRFADIRAVQAALVALCADHGIKGTLLIAPEGLNGTIAGGADGIAAVVAHIRALPGCAEMPVKYAVTETMPFYRMKVRLKREIVSMGAPDLDPATVGTYVEPADWNAVIVAPGTLIIDTRNDYEVRIGSFAGAIDPGTRTFRDFPAWFAANRAAVLAAPRVAMFCTGGIRCEKASAFLQAEGVPEVLHLKGGILDYLEAVPADVSLWQGECFVFDERVAVGNGLSPGSHSLCRACRMPVSPEDRQSPLYAEGVSCPGCHASRSAEQRAAYAERHRQTALAMARGEMHVGKVSEGD